ncbi:MAG: glycoside hydrolase family 28 protein [Lachnospiraceae bacterium]|nr:glycoside hydrolase family 28 protein [Lachnospiraceae bacterium]
MMIDVTQFGAVGDGITLDTAALQQAIDTCYANGGGTVVLPGGKTYKCGSLVLKSNVELHLESGARLLASDNMADYRSFGDITKDEHDDVPSYINCEYNGKPANFFLYAPGGENIRITGYGVIDGNEEMYYGKQDQYHIEGAYYPRTPLLFLEHVKHLTVEHVTLTRSAFWTLHMVGCEDVLVEGVRILNNLKMANCDGIDPDHCRDVRIHGCYIESADDCIVLKTSGAYQEYGPTENIVISDCILMSTSAAIKIGTESEADFRHIYVHHCIIKGTGRAVSLQLRDGGNISDVDISHLDMETRAFSDQYWGQSEGICMTAIPRHTGLSYGTIKHVRISDITLRGENGIFLYSEDPDHIKDITIKDVKMTLTKTTKWEIEGYDLRPCDGEGMLRTKVYGLYQNNVDHLKTKRIKVQVAENFKPFYGGECNDNGTIA